MNDKKIECKVDDCKFHQKGDVCTASSIKVDWSNKTMMECADCKTYSPMGEECGCH